MPCQKSAIALAVCLGLICTGLQASEATESGNNSAPMRLCIDAWGKIATCPHGNQFNADDGSDEPESMWLGVEPDVAPAPPAMTLDAQSPFSRWRGKGHWDLQWSLFSGAKDVGLNLAVDRGRPWVNMDLGKVEINMQLDDDDAEVYIGIGNKW